MTTKQVSLMERSLKQTQNVMDRSLAQTQDVISTASAAIKQRDELRAALSKIRAVCDTRMREGTAEYADMLHIYNIAKEVL